MKRRGLERTSEVDISSVASGRDEVQRNYVSFGLLNLEVPRSGGNPKKCRSFIEFFDALMGT